MKRNHISAEIILIT